MKRRTIWSWIVLLPLLALLLPMLGGIVAAADKTWTTTADFDGGTKSAPGDGNLGIETTTDNAIVPAGGFELANMLGDEFTTASASGDTFKWTPKNTGAGSGNCQESVTAGIYKITESTILLSNDCGTTSDYTFGGSMDIFAKFDLSAGAKSYDMCLISTKECTTDTAGGWTASANGIFYWNNAGSLRPAKVVAGVTTYLGTATTQTANPLWLRISRATDDWTFKYSTDGSSWTTDETVTVASVPALLYAGFDDFHSNTATITVLNIDSFQAVAGSISAGGYRTSGNWLSDSYTVTSGNRVSTVVIGTSGLTTTYAIDQIELFRNGVSQEAFTTDITSGTSKTLTMQTLFEGGTTFSVKAYLKGDGAGTPLVTQIDVNLVASVNAVSTRSADEIGMTSARLNGNLTYAAEPSGFVHLQFEWGTTPALGETSDVGWFQGTGSQSHLFHLTLVELSPATTHYFRATVTGNTTGTAVGEILEFTTLGTPDLSTDLLMFVILSIAAILLGILGFVTDNFIFLVVSGIVTFLASFQSYILTGSIAVSLVLVSFGLLLLVLPVSKLLEKG